MTSTSSSSAATTIETYVTNPGIADRLEQDIIHFEQFDFSFQRIMKREPLSASSSSSSSSTTTTTQTQKKNEGGCKSKKEGEEEEGVICGILTCKPLPPPSLDFDTQQQQSCDTQTISPPPPPPPPPHLYISIPNPSHISSLGPFLRTLVRLTPSHYDPRLLRVFISLDWISSEEKEEEEEEGKKIAHHVHMLIRNSMGAALFLTSLCIILPKNVSIGEVKREMEENPFVNYPSVQLLHRDDENAQHCGTYTGNAAALSSDCVIKEGQAMKPVTISNHFYCYTAPNDENDSKISQQTQPCVYIKVQTRMCTVRYTPILYQLAKYLSSTPTQSKNASLPFSSPLLNASSTKTNDTKRKVPMLVVCVDKLANLFRIFMLSRDYNVVDKLLLVVQNEKSKERFEREGLDFMKKLKEGGDEEEEEKKWKVVTISEAVLLLQQLLLSSSPSSSSSEISRGQHDIVAIDIHENAFTLDDDDDNNDATTTGSVNDSTSAMQLLQNAKAVIWGFEKDGIPSSLLSVKHALRQMLYQDENGGGDDEKDQNNGNNRNGNNSGDEEEDNEIVFVEIPCRSSLNLVAAMSIILHCGYEEGKSEE